ncbi:MAG: dihydroxy-acid dehydratase [Marinicella sp.]
MKQLNPYSKAITQDDSQPAAKAMLHAIGLTPAQLNQPFVGIASTGYQGNPCNMHLNDLADKIKQAVNQFPLNGLIFNTIGISDGISMGTSGMHYSLPSRDLIADSIETVVAGMHYDAVVTVVGCDKNMPGADDGHVAIESTSIAGLWWDHCCRLSRREKAGCGVCF